MYGNANRFGGGSENFSVRPIGQRLAAALTIVGVTAALLCATASTRAGILYGDFAGNTVDYLNVQEDDQGLYGEPVISGDTLAFTPVDFEVLSSGEVPPALVDGSVSFVLSAKPGFILEEVRIAEAGSFNLLGVGTDFTRVAVSLVLSIDVLEVANTPVAVTPFAVNRSMAAFDLLTDGVNFAAPWDNEVVFDIAALAAEFRNVDGPITKVSLNLNNVLLAQSESGTTSYIDKKAIDALTITTPEPGTLALAALGGTMILYGRFRRRA